MNIALIAHDRKKELMVQFCTAYCGILAEHNLCATHVTGKLVASCTEAGKTLEIDVPDGIDCLGNEEMIKQLTVILLSNALKYSDPGGRIEVFPDLRPVFPGSALRQPFRAGAAAVRRSRTGLLPGERAL